MPKHRPLVPVKWSPHREKMGKSAWEVDCRKVAGWSVQRRFFDSEDAAHGYAAEVRKWAHHPTPLEHQTLSFSTYVERWLTQAKPDLAEKTWRSYEYLLNRYVLRREESTDSQAKGKVTSRLGHTPLIDIRRADIKALLGKWRQQGLSKNTVRLIRAAISVVLGDAVEDEILQTNPALGIGRRKRKGAHKLSEAERKEKIRSMTGPQVAIFLAVPTVWPYNMLFEILIKCGLRPGEALALRPEDLDLKAGAVHVERAWSLGQAKVTKTEQRRDVELCASLVHSLKRHLVRLSEVALKNGWGTPTWLLPNEDGQPLDESKVGRVWRQTLKRAGLSKFTPYDSRHTFASLLLARGAPITYVAAQLGHASPATTLRWYGHHIPKTGRRWVGLLDRPEILEPVEPDFGTQLVGSVGSD